MKPRIYLETTGISYLTARLSRDLIVAAHQQITQEWWHTRRTDFDLFVSQLVVQESSTGDTDAAARRLAILEDMPTLEQSEEATALAQTFIEQIPLPEKAAVDALLIAIAVMSGMDYLLLWKGFSVLASFLLLGFRLFGCACTKPL